MKIKHSSYFASIVIAGILASSALSAAPRSTPVTVVNDAASPVPVTVQSLDAPQFVGFTIATFDGAQGMATYTNACNQDYAGSYMCTSEEFLNSSTYPATSGGGWIRPTYVPSAATQDMSGASAKACGGWSVSGNASFPRDGLYVDFSGKFSGSTCHTVKAVACCM
jgi:hypothetical protein